MLRTDAEEGTPPTHVLTLTSRLPVEGSSSSAYSLACAAFWKAWRRSHGPVEYCGFIEWTTGEKARDGKRRMHSHWLVKLAPGTAPPPHEWISAKWRDLHDGAWVVELAALEHAGGVVGYLALHHEKWEQRPPAGWTGRRLRPSKGYFSEDGHRRRARARLYLAELRESKREWPRPFGELERPRMFWKRPELERLEREHVAGPGQSFASPLNRRWLDRQLARSLDRLPREAEGGSSAELPSAPDPAASAAGGPTAPPGRRPPAAAASAAPGRLPP